MWRAGLLSSALCSACGFTALAPIDATEAPDDAPVDAPPDGPARVATGLVALYRFDEGIGNKVHDTSNVAPAMDATIGNELLVTWSVGELLVGDGPAVEIATPAGAGINRISQACAQANAITVEAWVLSAAPAQVGGADESARVVTMSVNAGARNFAIGQHGTSWQGQVRAMGATDDQGNPALRGGTVTTTVQHLALTANATTRKLYVDGAEVASGASGSFAAWDLGYRVGFGSESTSLGNPWNGRLLLVAIYARELSATELALNRGLGPNAP